MQKVPKFISTVLRYNPLWRHRSGLMIPIWTSGNKIAIFHSSWINILFPRKSFWLFPVRIISRTLWRQFWFPVIWLVEGFFSVINASVTLKSSTTSSNNSIQLLTGFEDNSSFVWPDHGSVARSRTRSRVKQNCCCSRSQSITFLLYTFIFSKCSYSLYPLTYPLFSFVKSENLDDALTLLRQYHVTY